MRIFTRLLSILSFLKLSAVLAFLEQASFEGYDGYKVHYGKMVPSNPCEHVIVLPGRGASYTELNFFLKKLYDRNIAVYMADPRGTGGNTRLVEKSNAQHIQTFDDYILDLKSFIVHLNLKNPVHLLGASHGGHVALRTAIDCQEGLSGYIASVTTLCPMVEFYTSFLPLSFAKGVADTAWLFGFGKSYAFTKGDTTLQAYCESLNNGFEVDNLKIQEARKSLEKDLTSLVGGPTFEWVSAAIFSVRELQKTIQKLNVKSFMVICENDSMINTKSQKILYDHIPSKKKLYTYKAPHDFFYAKEDVLNNFLKKWLDFIKPDEVELEDRAGVK